MPTDAPEGWEVFYAVVRTVPRGRVSTYGAIAKAAGLPGYARQVGYALAALRDRETKIPWHRILGSGARGWAELRLPPAAGGALQREKLLAEGVDFEPRGRVSLARFGAEAMRPFFDLKAPTPRRR